MTATRNTSDDATTDTQSSATATRSPRIEACGVKGVSRRSWRRTFRDAYELMAWCEKNDAEVTGQRFIDDQLGGRQIESDHED